MFIRGQRAIVTGGASGLGEATARLLAENSAIVTIFDLDEERGRAIADDIKGNFVRVDVGDEASIDQGFAEARAVHGQERILVACAGIATAEKIASRDRSTGEPVAHRLSTLAKAISVNLTGTFACVARSAAGMMGVPSIDPDGQRGVIITTASVAAQDGQVGQGAYAASRGGVEAMTLPVARDLMGDGIRVNCILPGIVETPMLRGLPSNVQAALRETVPFPKRPARPEEFADAALFLIRNDYMNGATLRLDGALRAPPR